MEVRPSYKQTEVGVIPDDWEVKPLQALSEKIMVGIASSATHAYRDRGVVLFRNQNIKPGHLDDEDILHIAPVYEATFKNKRLKPGDILIARTGYPGTACIVPPTYDSAQSFTTLIARPQHQTVSSDYLCHYINSEQGQAFFEQNQIGGGQKNVNAGSLQNMPIPLPPLPEQHAIAKVLSDVDALIAALDRLIGKKRAIKQGAMQRLLTGQTRLSGFSGEWEVQALSDVLDYEQPVKYLVKDTEYIDTGTPVLTAGKTFILGHTDEQEGIYTNLPVIVFDDFTTASRYVDFPFKIKSSAIKLLTAKSSDVDLRFVFERMQTIQFALGDHKRYYISEYQHIKTRVPPPHEQRAIAAVLSDMDAEIAALEARREKTRALKQGMMQELLTGKTRLV